MIFDLNVDRELKGELYLTSELMTLPDEILKRQAVYDEADRHYQYHIASASLAALSEPLFKGKDDSTHMASNDTERKIAIDLACVDNPNVIEARVTREAALRELHAARNRFEATGLMVRLLTKGDGR